jgi:glycosyltransferase involved in cell wall biosynthesis
MALGVPVVGVAAGGPAEIIEDGLSGLLVPRPGGEELAGALERIVGSDDLRERLTEGGRRAVEERFTTERMVEQLTSAIERLDANAGGGRGKGRGRGKVAA